VYLVVVAHIAWVILWFMTAWFFAVSLHNPVGRLPQVIFWQVVLVILPACLIGSWLGRQGYTVLPVALAIPTALIGFVAGSAAGKR